MAIFELKGREIRTTDVRILWMMMFIGFFMTGVTILIINTGYAESSISDGLLFLVISLAALFFLNYDKKQEKKHEEKKAEKEGIV